MVEIVKEDRAEALQERIERLERSQRDLLLAQEETVHRLSLAAEARDEDTSRHIERMSRYCAVIVGALGLDESHRDTIRIAAKMHDVGKACVPDEIRFKPGRLTVDEFKKMTEHAEIGHEILAGSTSELARTAASIAWTHHEKVNGKGYPRGLSGDEIPLEGRIAAVADVFDALTTDRVYRKGFTVEETVRIMREGRRAHFDDEILDLFIGHIDEVLEIKRSLDEA